MFLTISQGGESFAETFFTRKIQRVKSNSDLLCASSDIFKIQTPSTKQGNLGLLVDTSYVFRPNQAIKAVPDFAVLVILSFSL